MQWRLLNDSQKDYYNNFIINSPKGHVLQTWEWGQVKAAGEWEFLPLVVEEDAQIVAACLILKRSLPLKLGSIFYAPRGPVLDIERKDIWIFLWQAVAKLAKEHKALFCKIDPDVSEEDSLWRERLQDSGFKLVEGDQGFEGIQPRHVFRLDIAPDEESIMAGFHQKTRYNVRLAERKGVTVEAKGLEDLQEFYNLLCVTSERDRFLIRGYSYFETFYKYLAAAGFAQLFLVYYEGKAISGALAITIGKKAWYLYGASANEYRNVMPNYLMQWRMIQWAKSLDCTLYDFRGVPGDVGEDHPLYGLVKFKRGFGGIYTSFIGEYDLIFRPFTCALYRKFEPVYQKLVRKLIRFKRKIKRQN